MNRRRALKLVAGAGSVGLSGCSRLMYSSSPPPAPQIGIKDIHIFAHPGADGYEPIDVAAGVELNGSQLHSETHTITEPTAHDGFEIDADWLQDTEPYTVTVETSIHDEPTVFSLTEYEDTLSESELDETDCVRLRFVITGLSTRVAPHPEQCPDS